MSHRALAKTTMSGTRPASCLNVCQPCHTSTTGQTDCSLSHAGQRSKLSRIQPPACGRVSTPNSSVTHANYMLSAGLGCGRALCDAGITIISAN